MAGRIAACEDSIEKDKQEKNNIYARISGNERKAADTTARVAKIEKELEEIKKGGGLSSAAGSPVPAPPGDPWASYRAKNGPAPGMPGPPAAAVRDQQTPEGNTRDELSQEDRRTLVFGGWLQDTKRQVILDEAAAFLRRPDISDIVDAQDLTVWGPRRSFGVLRYKLRDGEEMSGLRDRMRKTIQLLRATPHRLASTNAAGDGKPMWCQFVKTREARRRSSHGSLTRRVCLDVARDCALNKEAHNVTATVETNYDVDWNSGTVWLGEWKLGSCIHRQPKNDGVRLLSSGWIDVDNTSRAMGVSFDVVLRAFEKEL